MVLGWSHGLAGRLNGVQGARDERVRQHGGRLNACLERRQLELLWHCPVVDVDPEV